MLFMRFLRLFAANPQFPNRVQSSRSYDFCVATVAFLRDFRLYAANQRKRLSMNNLHIKSGLSDQGSIKANQG